MSSLSGLPRAMISNTYMGQMVLVCYPEVYLQLQSLHKSETWSLRFTVLTLLPSFLQLLIFSFFLSQSRPQTCFFFFLGPSDQFINMCPAVSLFLVPSKQVPLTVQLWDYLVIVCTTYLNITLSKCFSSSKRCTRKALWLFLSCSVTCFFFLFMFSDRNCTLYPSLRSLF